MPKQLRLKNPDSWNPHPSETEPMFAGQDTHPLTREEKKAFLRRLDYPEAFTDADDKIEAAFDEMAQTPTGREQMREIINAEPKDRKFKINVGEVENGAHGKYDSEHDCVTIPEKTLEANPQQLGETLLHELSHANHMSVNTTKLFSDCETQAVSAQLDAESNPPIGDVIYNKNYQNNLKEWRSIAEGKKDPPKWAKDMPFEYQPSAAEKESGQNDPVREAKAREMYARKMASLETRSDRIEDMYSSDKSLEKGYKSSDTYSYGTLESTLDYTQQEVQNEGFRDLMSGAAGDGKGGKGTPTKSGRDEVYAEDTNDRAGIEDLSTRYPSLKKDVMMPRAGDIKKEIEAKRRTQGQGNATDLGDDATKARVNKAQSEIANNPNLSETQKLERMSQVVADNIDGLPKEKAADQLLRNIIVHQQLEPGKSAARDRMVADYEKITGRDIPSTPVSQNKAAPQQEAAPKLKRLLREAGQEVDTNAVEQENARQAANNGKDRD